MAVDIKSLVRTIPDYPKPGILFRDITTLIENADGLRACIDQLTESYLDGGFTHVAGIEARGFIFGTAVALSLGTGFVPIRKHGKLPGETISKEYALEYGSDRIELHADVLGPSHKVLLIDDLIATGGTAIAAVQLMRTTGATVDHAAFVIDLPVLGGLQKLKLEDVDVRHLISFDGH